MSKEIKGMKVAGEVYSLSDINARERLEAVEYQTVITDLEYEHTDLPKVDKTVSINNDSVWGDTIYISTGKDLVPRQAFNRAFPWNGLTITRNDMTYHASGTTTAGASVVFGYAPSNIYIPVESLRGKVLKLLSFANKATGYNNLFQVNFLDSDKKSVSIEMDDGSTRATVATYVGKTSLTGVASVKVPIGATYMCATIGFPANVELDFDFQVYILVDELTTTTNTAELVSINSEETIITTIPYKSTIELKWILKDYIKYVAGGGDSGVTIDKTLTQEGKSADAKATGDRLLEVEYQTIEIESAIEHKDLPIGDKIATINSNSIFGDTAYVCAERDLIPRKTFNRDFPYNGITITRNEKTYHVEGTAIQNTTLNISPVKNNIYIPIDKDLAGKSMKLLSFINQLPTEKAITLGVRFYDSDGQKIQILNKYGALANQAVIYFSNTSLMTSTDFSIPEDANIATMDVYLSFSSGVTFDHDFQVYIVESSKTSQTTLDNPMLLVGNTDTTDILSFPYPCSLNINAPIAEYVKYIAKNAEGDKATYLMPETFGAIGDGFADDSVPIALCLAMAAETKQTVLMAKRYFVASPIDIKYDGLNIIANDIVYNGLESAVKISGTKNALKIHSINSNSIGIAFRADREQIVSVNDIDINSINTKSHGIVFYNGLKGICQNTIKFNYIYCAGSGCYGICALDAEGDSWIGENNFYGGQISQCEWAVYGLGGNSKFYGVHPEYEVQGGYYIDNGYVTIFHSRIAESQRDGNLPIYKFKGANHTTIYDSSGIYINQIDLSEMPESFTAASGIEFPMFENAIGVINGKIICSNIEDGRNGMTSNIYTNKAYIWGKHLIMTPYMAFRKVVTTPILDTRIIGTETTDTEIRNLAQLPTKFVVDNINSDIYLHPSYCAFGFNEFEVEQANGFTCKVYAFVKIKNDEGIWEDGSVLIFDGAEHGDGLYRFNSYKDSTKTVDHYGALYYDRSNQYWEVIKQGASVTDDGAGNVTLTTEVLSI